MYSQEAPCPGCPFIAVLEVTHDILADSAGRSEGVQIVNRDASARAQQRLVLMRTALSEFITRHGCTANGLNTVCPWEASVHQVVQIVAPNSWDLNDEIKLDDEPVSRRRADD